MASDSKVIFSPTARHNAEYEQRIDQVGALPSLTLPPAPIEASHSAKQRLRDIGKAAKSTTKKVLHIDDTRGQVEHGLDTFSHAIENHGGLNPSKTLDTEASSAQKIKDKLPIPHSTKELKEVIFHPKTVLQEQAAEALAVSENPYLIRSENDDLIDAHEKLKSVEQSDTAEIGYQKNAALSREINALEQDREEKRVAWTSSRYVSCIRVLSAQQYTFPFLSSCRWVDESGKPQGVQWSQWTDQVQSFFNHLYAPQLQDAKSHKSDNADKREYDQDILLQDAERIIISSNGLQQWFSDLHKIREWQSSTLTGLWFTTWLVAWSCNRVFTFIYCYGAYRAMQTRTAYDKRESLKETHIRAADDDEANKTFSEMIGRFGSSKWLQPTLEAVGPALQPILRSTADWLEILVNYPEWKTPRATWCIMASLGSAIVFSSLLSSEFCLRALTLVAILTFFVDKPLSRRYPRYWQILVPLHWVLWDVPTDTETSFAYLRQQAQALRHQLESKQAVDHGTGDAAASVELFAAQCSWNSINGAIVLTPTEIYFVRSFPRQEAWRRRFEDIEELKKGEGETSLMHKTQQFAELRFKDGSVMRLLSLKKNDTLFNVIFAFSGLQWRQE